ncbi:MAG: coproporphyrinogen III oxidase [Deltaproteobacteria bacterium]|nr:coproporphyrinogen III oxidase [Deltaproteobacteria bacterium]
MESEEVGVKAPRDYRRGRRVARRPDDRGSASVRRMTEPGHTEAHLAPGGGDDGRVGVYVHLPWCERVCPYCDFAVLAARPLDPGVEDRYVEDLRTELAARAPAFGDRPLASLYLGGGTPALFRPESIARLVDAVTATFPADASAPEITLELNPSTVERERLPAFRAAGVNRLSIGIQSFDDGLLKRLGRAHRAVVAEETLAAARRAGFDDLSVDLIFAGPDQSAADLDRDLDRVIAFGPEHVSTYELTFESETPFGRAVSAGRMTPPDEELAAGMIEQVEARLEGAGYRRYEVSSYARPGRRARHNARYWQRQAVLGLGMGAHSTEVRTPARPHGARRANPRDLSAWQAALARDPAEAGEEEGLEVAVARGEAIFLGLRQIEGVAAQAFAEEFGAPPRAFFAEEIDRLVRVEWLVEGEGGDLRLSRAGRLLADSVGAEFVFVEGG